jgi:hypothetical protein
MPLLQAERFGIVHDALSLLARRKRADGASKSYRVEAAHADVEPHTPELTLHFRFVPDAGGVMHIRGTGSMTRQVPDGFVQRSLVPVDDVQAMLTRSRKAWSERHPKAGAGT